MRDKSEGPTSYIWRGLYLHAKILESACRSWLCTTTHARSPNKPCATPDSADRQFVLGNSVHVVSELPVQVLSLSLFLSLCPFVLSPTYHSCAYHLNPLPPLRPYTFPLFNPLPLPLGVLSRPRLQQAPDFGSPC